MIELASAAATSSAPPERFQRRWEDHATWPSWSPDTEWVRIAPPVHVGSRGVMKLRGGPKLRFVVRVCDEHEYTDETVMPGARVLFRHTAAAEGTGSGLGVRVTISGPLAALWALPLRGGFRTSVPADLGRLVALVEQEA